ncbi:exodeoxyribonuclease V subunit beta [Polynucleobacter sp. es-MAR-4]|uniref:UvrD-helicase domain-containing protein n=1 Tax=Polynucleobacter sp. es-MAR-4 TaxID=1855655 RepID=UPI002103E228|nr:UvrD-helicase domain-containing protein [Polynucleobacter sp. es-MAR-4]
MSKSTFPVDIACDPNRSVIVSACAGSGKTWLLVTRMVRLLLAGAKPQEILALTFTRKAAQEMRDRLYRLLEEFSQSSEEQLIGHLTERGLSADEAKALLPTAKSLYAKVLANPQGIVIDTFHGWFGRLLGAAPISAGIQPGFSLREDAKRLQEECLDDWWGNLPDGIQVHYDTLLKALGASETQKFLMSNYSLFKQRGAWVFFSQACKAHGTTPIEKLKADLPRLKIDNPLNLVWDAINAKADLEFLHRCFSNSSATEMAYAPIIQTAINLKASGGDVMEMASALQSVFLTQDDSNRTSNDKAAGDLKKYLKKEGEQDRELEHVTYKQAWATAFLEFVAWKKEQEAYALNEAWFAMSAAMLDHVNTTKESMRVRDFDDLEIGVSQLMADSANAAYLQSRLDAKYKHILVDEFQDTNPLQWQILRAWLEGYGQDESKPTVFIVGDPKQSIYRFRRADPRLFNDAQAFLVKEMNAASLNQNTTRRNALKINEAVNQIFGTEQLPQAYPFTAQNTLWKAPAGSAANTQYSNEGEAYLLPLVKYEAEELEQRAGNAFEEAIVDARQTADVTQRYVEGQQVSALIQYLIETRPVADRINGKEVWRKARESDFLLLVKRRKYLPQFERALREAGLAFESSRLGGLLNTLEVDDLIALLTVLVTPRHDLPLAQVLRSPIFAFTESQMQALSKSMASNQYRSWWDALQDSPDVSLMQAARYLEHWRMLGERLPVHDLLDRIYQESDLRIKYASASQEIARAQVLANLDAFLELALNQDGGRYPSLGRFIEEINTIRRGDDDETPDEGDVEAEVDLVELDEESELSEEDKHKRVRMMTIHGAKGLESPFVIMLDANHTEGKADHRGVLLDWPPENESPSHLSMYTSATLTNPRREVRERELLIGKNENWNLLYVAMTRAKQGLWISGVAKAPTAKNPTGLDEKSWYGRAMLGQLATLEDQFTPPTNISPAPTSQKPNNPTGFMMDDFELSWGAAKVSHEQQLKDIESGMTLEVFQGDDSAPDNSKILEEGVHFHRLLEHLAHQTGATSPEPMSADQIARWLGIGHELASKALDQANTVLNTQELQPYLTANQWVQAWNEIDVVSLDGRSFRLDRLVEFDDHLAILDYKLTIPEAGSEAHSKYRAQLNNYKQELTRIRPDKPAKAYLISAKGELKEMS